MIYYRITENQSFDHCALTNSSRVVTAYGRSFWNDLSLWQVAFHPDNQWNVGFVLQNKGTGLLMVPQSIEDGSEIVGKNVPDDGVIPDEWVWQTNLSVQDVPWTRTIMPLLNKDICIATTSYSRGYPPFFYVNLASWNSGHGVTWNFEQVIQ